MIGLSSINKMIKARKAKSGMGGLDFVQRSKTPTQKNKMVNEQICEVCIFCYSLWFNLRYI
ncbi:hypothetical protein NW066_02440 [Mycoplasmopsis felis]|uniref:hypothetical protein n=1 Tax=Mycoplasmopsis felis TaxID=33923 RepID=UPI0021AEFB7E|nr:hypothetical protein [Mycoplasmopsis felis]UWV85528.1 hypothetical protein NW066_02440 [Mycoplasmopsis felis]